MLVKIIIPIYTLPLKEEENAALAHTLEVLHRYPFAFLKPESLDISTLTARFPKAEVVSVSDNWLGLKRGIAGYNEMTMSQDFYDRFADCEYILICHTDAWIFRDELEHWCQQGYDILGAPWPTRPRYRHFPLKQYLRLRRALTPKDKILHQDMFDHIGNGGLCLRRVSAFSNACVKYKEEIERFNSKTDVLYNEDLFWALIPKEFHYPSVTDALKFSFDLKPKLSYELNHNELPMGCHGFNKPERRAFWEKYIKITTNP
jgi:hypothetical protein